MFKGNLEGMLERSKFHGSSCTQHKGRGKLLNITAEDVSNRHGDKHVKRERQGMLLATRTVYSVP